MTASVPSHVLFAENQCAWTNAKLTISENLYTRIATLSISKKRLRGARPDCGYKKYGRINVGEQI